MRRKAEGCQTIKKEESIENFREVKWENQPMALGLDL